MTLNAYISAAAFLWAHSPASCVSEDKNVILVSGMKEDERADALFSLLFSTAYKPGLRIRLLRLVPKDAEEAEMDFVSRNEKGINAFARNAYSSTDENRPLTIQFFNESDPNWKKEADRTGYVIDLNGGTLEIACACHFHNTDIPMLSPKGANWAAQDEKDSEVLRIARKVHTAYTAGWNSRYSNAQISEELYGGKSDYCLRSSLRFAVSIPWKLAAVSISPDDSAAEKLYNILQAANGEAQNVLAWQEHRSWSAFMTLDGWAAPDPDQIREYLFSDGNDQRNKQNKLHPCLCDLLQDDWNVPYPKRLKNISIRQWSAEIKCLEDYCLLDRISLIIHHHCKETVVSPEYGEKMRSLFRSLEAALIYPGITNADELIQYVRLMENMFSRLKNNETNSFHPWQRSFILFQEKIKKGNNPALDEVQRICRTILQEAKIAVERNKYCDYKEIDTGIIRWLPWIVSREEIKEVWKLYSRNNPLENILSSIILKPEVLCLICFDGDMRDISLDIYTQALARHGVYADIRVIPVSSLTASMVPVPSMGILDVTGCGEMQNWLRCPPDTRIIFYDNNDLQDKKGSRFFAPLFHPYDYTMTVDEMISLRGWNILSDTESNEMLGMDKEYAALWEAHQKIRFDPGLGKSAWHFTIAALQMAEAALRKKIYRDCGMGMKQFAFSFTPEKYELMAKNSVIKTLYELQKNGCISDLHIDVKKCMLKCYIFASPVAQNGDYYAETENNLRCMLEDSSLCSMYAVVDDYIKANEPYCFINLKEPLLLDINTAAQAIALKNEHSAAYYSTQISRGIQILLDKGLLVKAPEGDKRYCYKSLPVRHELQKDGFALEAYVYYSLFLSGAFDDVRCNIRIQTGKGAIRGILEKELDILVTRKGKMGLISCKDTPNIDTAHIGELRQQADLYGINVQPILVCTEAPKDEHVDALCRYINVKLITVVNENLSKWVIRNLG